MTSSNAVPARSGGSVDAPGARLLELVAVVDTLRRSCPWDREQTHASLVRYLLEEAYEAAETIEDGDMPALREEIGDVLFQVLFHARIASERSAADGGFTIDDVADTLAAKLIRRHPHVFAGVSVASAADVSANWEEIKKAERAAKAGADGGSQAASALEGVPFGQPALSLAAQLQRRAARAGIIVPVGAAGSDGSDGSDGAAGSDGETGLTGERLGAELMALVARAQQAGLDPEQELRGAARRFADQVRDQEQASLFARAPSRCYEQAEVIDAVSGNHRNACLSDSANREVHPPIPTAIAQRARAVTLVYLDPGGGRRRAGCLLATENLRTCCRGNGTSQTYSFFAGRPKLFSLPRDTRRPQVNQSTGPRVLRVTAYRQAKAIVLKVER